MTNINDIIALQKDVKKQIAAGAPGRRGGLQGCCTAFDATAKPEPRQAKVDKFIKGNDLKVRIETVFKDPTAPIVLVRDPVTNRTQLEFATKEPARCCAGATPANTMRYSFKALQKLVMADLTARGINTADVDINFDQLGCVCRAK